MATLIMMPVRLKHGDSLQPLAEVNAETARKPN